MKVDVLTVGDIKISQWRWWSNWIDVAVFDYNYTPFLLQMRISRTNAKDFNAIRITGRFIYRKATTNTIGDLIQMISTKPEV